MTLNAIHPGEHLAEELKELGMSAAELARQLDVPTNRVTEILNGRRAITGDTALRLAHFLGTTAEFWLNLQSLYEIRVAQKKGWEVDSGVADPEASRTSTRIEPDALLVSRCSALLQRAKHLTRLDEGSERADPVLVYGAAADVRADRRRD